MNFYVLQVFLYAPVTQPHERTQINVVNVWNNSKHEKFWLLSAVLLQLADPLEHQAAHLSLQPIFERPFPDV